MRMRLVRVVMIDSNPIEVWFFEVASHPLHRLTYIGFKIINLVAMLGADDKAKMMTVFYLLTDMLTTSNAIDFRPIKDFLFVLTARPRARQITDVCHQHLTSSLSAAAVTGNMGFDNHTLACR